MAEVRTNNGTSAPGQASPVKEGLVRGFAHFVREHGIAPLAVGVVIGNAVNDLVKSLVDGLITPFIALVSPRSQLQTVQIEFSGSVFKIGQVINSVLTFLIVALIVYIVARVVLRNENLLKKK